MRFIITGDLHFRGTNPRARIDNYQAAISDKLAEVFDVARTYKANAIVIPGDLFDSPHTSLPVIGSLASLLQAHYQHSPGCQVLTVAGNHDVFGGNQGTRFRTPYGLLERLGLIRDLQDHPWYYPGIDHDHAVLFSGHGFDTDTDRDIQQYLPTENYKSTPWYDWEEPIIANARKVHVVHGMVLDKRPGFELRHTLLSEIASQQDAPSVIVAGHEHLGWGIKTIEAANEHGQMMAINPGALCRLSANPAEIERQIQVCLLEVSPTMDISARLVPLLSAKPGHEVLSREHLEAQAEREAKITEFLGLLAEEGETRFLETRDIIEDISRREKMPRAVVNEALRRLGEAREKAVV